MKKSKMLLGAIVVCLAAAGAITTKANTKLTTYYVQSATTTCSIDDKTVVDCANGTLPCKDADGRQVFSSQGDGHICQSPVDLKN